MRLVVNLPTYNEEETIEKAISSVLAQAKNLKNIDLHVLVADSHSPDKTGDIVKRISSKNPRVHYLDVKERGLGVGIVKGHRFAINRLKADMLAQMDADLSHDPSSLPKMVTFIENGYDLVNGSRLIKGGKNLLGIHRRIFTKGASLVCQISWGEFKLSEFTNSYRVFTKELFEKIDFTKVPWKSQTYIIQPAFLYAAIEAGAKIKEVPITFEDRRGGYSKSKIYNYIVDVLVFGSKVRLKRSKTFIKFLVVGTIGYLVNAIALGILNRGSIYGVQILQAPLLSQIPAVANATYVGGLGVDRLLASATISTELSIISNFLFHNNWTFKKRSTNSNIASRFFRFNMTSLLSPLIQLVSILVFAKALGLNEQIGLAVGVGVGLFVNYFINIFWIWKASPAQSKHLPNAL